MSINEVLTLPPIWNVPYRRNPYFTGREHVQICKAHIEQWKMAFPEAAQLLYQAGYYLQSHAQYAQAEQLFNGALAIYERFREPDHPDVIACLDHLAVLFYKQGKYNEAGSFYH